MLTYFLKPSSQATTYVQPSKKLYYLKPLKTPNTPINIKKWYYLYKLLLTFCNFNLTTVRQLPIQYTSLTIPRVQRLHKRAGKKRRKFMTTITIYQSAKDNIMFTLFNRALHFINIAGINFRLYIIISYFQNNYIKTSNLPIWVEKHTINLIRLNKLLKR